MSEPEMLHALQKHKTIIEGNLDTFNSDDRILQKYLWLKCYHNTYCQNNYHNMKELLIA
jgi:hypothetical protein